MSKLDLSIIIKFVDKATQPIRQFQKNLQNTNQSIDRLTQSIDRLERSMNGGRSFKQYSRNLQGGSADANAQVAALDSMGNGYDKVGNALDVVQRKTQSWSDTLKANRAQMREEMKSLAVNSVIAGAGLYQFLKPAVDFEKQMSGVQSVLDLEKQSEAMKKLTADARKWGAASSFSPGEAAQAQFALGSGGFNSDQILKSLGGVLQLAEAGKVELDRAAQIAVGTLNGFGLAASEIGRVNDVFLKGTNLTATSVDGLGETMKYVAPIAKAYGASIEQATAMTGLLGDNNILDTQAGTSLRSIMTRFAGPPKEASKAFAKLKIETKDSNGNLRDMSDILAEVNVATKKMGSGERLDIFKDIAGQEAVSAFAVLVDQTAIIDENTGQTVNKIKELTKELENSEGAAARAAAILKDNLAGDIEQLGGSVQDLSISMLNALGTDIRAFVQSVGAFIDRIKVWVEANPELVRTIGSLILKLLMFKVAILSIRYTGNLLLGTIFSLIAGITKFALFMWIATKVLGKFGIGMPSRFTLISTAVRVLGNAFMFLSRQALPLLIAGLRTLSIALLTNPITWIIAAVAALALVIWKYWGPIKAFFVGFWDGLKIGLAPLFDALSSAFSTMKTALMPLMPVWNALVTAFNWVKEAIAGLFTPFQATNQQLSAATANGKSFGTSLGTILGVMGTVILKIIEFGATLFNIVGTSIGYIAGFIVTTFQAIPAFFSGIWNSITTAFSGGIAGIGALILNWSPLGLFYSAFASVLSWFGIDLPAKFTGFGAMILEGLKNGILSKVNAVKDAITGAVSGVIDKAKSILDIHSPSRVFMGIGGYTMQGMANGIAQANSLPMAAMNNVTNSVIDAAQPQPFSFDLSSIISKITPQTKPQVVNQIAEPVKPQPFSFDLSSIISKITPQTKPQVVNQIAEPVKPQPFSFDLSSIISKITPQTKPQVVNQIAEPVKPQPFSFDLSSIISKITPQTKPYNFNQIAEPVKPQPFSFDLSSIISKITPQTKPYNFNQFVEPVQQPYTALKNTAITPQPVKPIAPIHRSNAKSFVSNDTIEIHIHVKDGSVVKGTADALRQEMRRVAQEEQNARRKFLTDSE